MSWLTDKFKFRGVGISGVEAVCATLGVEAELVLDGVASLADKSLLLTVQELNPVRACRLKRLVSKPVATC